MILPSRRSFLTLANASAALVVAGCGGAAPTTFDLTAPRSGAGFGRGNARALVVPEPSTIFALDSERIVVRASGGELTYLPRAQWSDRLPRLIQTRLIQTFENRGRVAVGRPTDRLVGTSQLLLDIRAFEVREGSRDAVIELAAKLVNATTGRVIAARLFTASSPVGSIDGAGVSQALDQALARVLGEITQWAGSLA